MRRLVLAASAASWLVACGLNPQPLPPDDSTLGGIDGSISDAANPNMSDSGAPKDGGGALPDASITDADVDASDAGDAGDASRDADTDGG